MYSQLTSTGKAGRLCGLCGLFVVTVNGNCGKGVGFESEFEINTKIKTDKAIKNLTFIFTFHKKKVLLSLSIAHAMRDDNFMIMRKNFYVYLYISPLLTIEMLQFIRPCEKRM